MKRYKLYLFDFDGTLLNTKPALSYVFKVSYAHVGLEFDVKDTMEFARIPLIVGYERMNGKPEDFPEFCRFIEQSLDFPDALHSNSPFEETLEFLRYLKEQGIHAGIVTSNTKKHVHDVLNILNIPTDIFELYIGNKECEKHKPDPDPINKALQHSKIHYDREDVVYVGDGINDTLSANAAGVDAVLIDRDNEFPESDKYIKIHNLLELFQ